MCGQVRHRFVAQLLGARHMAKCWPNLSLLPEPDASSVRPPIPSLRRPLESQKERVEDDIQGSRRVSGGLQSLESTHHKAGNVALNMKSSSEGIIVQSFYIAQGLFHTTRFSQSLWLPYLCIGHRVALKNTGG